MPPLPPRKRRSRLVLQDFWHAVAKGSLIPRPPPAPLLDQLHPVIDVLTSISAGLAVLTVDYRLKDGDHRVGGRCSNYEGARDSALALIPEGGAVLSYRPRD